jgi:uncharacterized protein (DUF2062 family)/2-polyprenyl-3-methyl-5-hydroxy-6-metoxy-1,4-benzoquinol methylase
MNVSARIREPARGWRRLIYDMRMEGAGRDSASVGAGAFIGCLPLYGFHLLLVIVIGKVLRLNRLQMYLAANISNPLFAPVLILAEVQTGAGLRRGEFHSLALETIKGTSPWTFGGDLVIGSLVVGAIIGVGSGLLTHAATAGARRVDPAFRALAHRTAERYLKLGITAWELARAKLVGDPMYADVLLRSGLTSGNRLIDVGCGRGLMLSVIAEARHALPPLPRAPTYAALVGIELRPRMAAIARVALESEAEILEQDIRSASLGPASAVLVLDVLHMIPAADHAVVLGQLASVLEPGGTMLVREVDAAGGWPFRLVQVGNRLKAILTGNWGQRFAFRTIAEWRKLLSSHGLVLVRTADERQTPFANVLFVLRKAL